MAAASALDDLPIQSGVATSAHQRALRHRDRYPEANVAAIELSIRVRSAAASMVAAFSRCLAVLGMNSIARYSVLRELHFAEDYTLTQQALSRQLRITSASVTYLVDCLEDEGLVCRSRDARNRRLTFVRLTRTGEETMARVVPGVGRLMAALGEEFSARDLAHFNRLLDRLERRADLLFRE